MSKRIKWVDIAKGLGILLVIYGHALGGIMNSNVTVTTQPLTIPYNVIYGFHMPLFFFLSGIFAVSWFQRDYKLAMKQKVFSLVIPYFIWTIITGGVMAAAQRVTNSGLGIRNILLSPINPFSEYWFLYVMFIIFVVYYWGGRLMGSNMLLFLSFILFFARPFVYKFWIFDAFSLNFLFFMLGTKVLGSMSIQKFLKVTKTKFILSVTLFVLVNIWYIQVIKQSNFMLSSYAKIVTISVGILLITYFSQLIENLPVVGRVLIWLGRASMAIYVMHLIPIAGARIVALKFLGITNIVDVSFVISVIALIVCVIGDYVFEKFQIGRLSLGQGLKKSNE